MTFRNFSLAPPSRGPGRVLAALAVVWVALLPAACSPLSGAPAGTQCFSAVDCASGLVCIKKGSIRVCSSDLTSIETEIDAGVDAPVAAAGDAALADGATAGDGAATPGDAAATDGGTAPVTEAGAAPADSGTTTDGAGKG